MCVLISHWWIDDIPMGPMVQAAQADAQDAHVGTVTESSTQIILKPGGEHLTLQDLIFFDRSHVLFFLHFHKKLGIF